MTPEKINRLLYQIQKLMYGVNFEVTLGIEVLANCFSLADVNQAIKTTFPNTNIDTIKPVSVSEQDFWEDVNGKLDYRGDNIGSYLKLNVKEETELKSKQNEIRQFISKYIIKDTKIFSFPFLQGVPGYPVYWEYSFVVLNTDGQSLFFYGSSSD